MRRSKLAIRDLGTTGCGHVVLLFACNVAVAMVVRLVVCMSP